MSRVSTFIIFLGCTFAVVVALWIASQKINKFKECEFNYNEECVQIYVPQSMETFVKNMLGGAI